MISRSLTVSRTARYFAIGAEPARATEFWIALHGYAQLAKRFLRQFRPLEDEATMIVAPEALSRFYLETMLDGRHGESVGATWLTREDREADLEDHLAYLDRLADDLVSACPAPPRLTILGFSQGSVMAARWALRGRVVPDRLVLWGTPLPRDVTPEALGAVRSGRPVSFTAGDRDPFAPAGSIEANATALRSHGVPAIARRFTGGHAIPPVALLHTAERVAP